MHAISPALIVLVVAGCAAVNQANPPEISADGLRKLDSRDLDLLYVYPEADFTNYGSIYVTELTVEFDESWLRQQSTGDPTNMRPKDRERITRLLRESFATEITATVATTNRYRIVAAPGPDTLIMQPALVELRINAPETFEPYSLTVFAEDAGSMKVQLELVEPGTDQTLLRLEDRRRGRSYGDTLRRQSSVQNRQESIDIFRRWARSLNAAMANNPS